MSKHLRISFLLGITCLVPVLVLEAQQPSEPAGRGQPASGAATKSEASSTSSDPVDRIKEEGTKRSQVMATLSYLTDVIGPRLTGSPNMKRAMNGRATDWRPGASRTLTWSHGARSVAAGRSSGSRHR